MEERQRLNGRYCGQAAPGPIESEMEAVGLRVVLKTDHEHVHSGFQAIYQFKKKDMLFRGMLLIDFAAMININNFFLVLILWHHISMCLIDKYIFTLVFTI